MESRPPTGSEKKKALLGVDVPGWYSREWLVPGDDPFIPQGAEPEHMCNSHYHSVGPRRCP